MSSRAPIGLSPRHVRGFDKEVAKTLIYLVEECGIRYRMPDGQHILLFPPDGKSQPFKVSAHRPAKDSLAFIRDFADQWSLPTQEVRNVR